MKCKTLSRTFTLAEAGRCSLNPGHRRPDVAPTEDEHCEHDDGEHAANRPAPSLGVGQLLYLLRLHERHEQSRRLYLELPPAGAGARRTSPICIAS